MSAPEGPELRERIVDVLMGIACNKEYNVLTAREAGLFAADAILALPELAALAGERTPEPEETRCMDTGALALNGACLIHKGDACLRVVPAHTAAAPQPEPEEHERIRESKAVRILFDTIKAIKRELGLGHGDGDILGAIRRLREPAPVVPLSAREAAREIEGYWIDRELDADQRAKLEAIIVRVPQGEVERLHKLERENREMQELLAHLRVCRYCGHGYDRHGGPQGCTKRVDSAWTMTNDRACGCGFLRALAASTEPRTEEEHDNDS